MLKIPQICGPTGEAIWIEQRKYLEIFLRISLAEKDKNAERQCQTTAQEAQTQPNICQK